MSILRGFFRGGVVVCCKRFCLLIMVVFSSKAVVVETLNSCKFALVHIIFFKTVYDDKNKCFSQMTVQKYGII